MTESTALAHREAMPALIPHGFEEAERMAERLAKSALLPDHFRGKPADVFWAIAYGLEIGLSPVAALRAVYVVKGRPGLYADAMVAVVMASRKAVYFRCIESTPTRAVFETQRAGDQPVRKAFTIDDAERAGLTRQNTKYQTEPERMLEARAKSWLAKLVYPDVLHGIQSVEELSDAVDLVETAPGTYSPPPAPTFTSPPPPAPYEPTNSSPSGAAVEVFSEPDQLEMELLACASQEEQRALLPRLQKLPKGPQRDQLRELWALTERRLSLPTEAQAE